MDAKSFFSDIVDKIKVLYEKICDFCRENKKTALICAALIVIVLVLVLILIIAGHKKKEPEALQMPLVLSEAPLIPNGPEINNDYTISRKTDKSWTEEELDKWFTIPSEKEINSLGKTNNAIVSEILGAAP